MSRHGLQALRFLPALVGLLTSPLRAVEIHIDASRGGDTNSGTATAPLKTLAAASARLAPGDICVIGPGVYREVLKPARSGEEGRPIVYRAAHGGRVTIAATDPVTIWKPDHDGVFKAVLEKAPVSGWVFHAGQRMTEARWPNVGTADFIDSPKATVDDVFADAVTKGKDGVIDVELPDRMPADWLKGARMWHLHWYNGWFAATLPVKAFDPASKRITLEKAIPYSDRPARTGLKFAYMLQGSRALLDADNEWAYSANEKTLYFRAPGGASPSLRGVEIATRQVVGDLRDRRFVRVENITFIGGRVLMNDKTADCVISGSKILYAENSLLAGARNEIRNSEIAFSQGCILSVSGERNRLVNNHLHDLGERGETYGVWLGGGEHLVAYNTFERAGQYLLNISTTNRCQVVHNFFRDASLIARDSGSIYSLMNGGNTEIAYNRFMTDYRRLKHVNGIYIDGKGSHFIIHHNVLPVIAANPAKPNVLYYHNTVYRYLDYTPHNDSEKVDPASLISMEFISGGDFAGNQHLNSLYAFTFPPFPGLTAEGNLACLDPAAVFSDSTGKPLDRLEQPWLYDFSLRRGSPAIDAGVRIPGFNDDFAGAAPDVGAYESGRAPWTAGHDFQSPRDIAFSRPEFAYANRLRNPGFELDHLAGWTPTGTRTATFQAGTFSWDNEKLDVWSHYGGARLGAGENGLEQKVDGLVPGERYLAWAWVKPTAPEQSVVFGLRLPDGRELIRELGAVTGWVRLLLDIRMPQDADHAIFFVRKTSADAGSVFFDETSLTRIWPLAAATAPGSLASASFAAVEDTFVHAAEPGQSFGYRSGAMLKEGKEGESTNRRPYFRFDLSAARGRSIEKATLRLYVTTVYRVGMPALAVHVVPDQSWLARGRGAITWETRPALGPVIAEAPAAQVNPLNPHAAVTKQHGWMSIDVTGHVRARLMADGRVSLALSDPECSSRLVGFATTQLMMAPPVQTYPPLIELTYAPATGGGGRLSP